MTETKVLAEKIERMVCELVAEQLEQTRLAVVAAVTRSFATSAEMSAPKAERKRASNRKPRARREPDEVAALAERLCKLVCASPGEAMTTFAADMGTTVRELHRPMSKLKDAGRVRSVGERHRTRYFPAVTASTNVDASMAS